MFSFKKTALLLCAAPALFSSCATVKEKTSLVTKKVTTFSISDLRPSRIDVVEVREKDLKEMKSGQDQALAFDQKRNRSFWSYVIPNFQEPDLPDASEVESDSFLLPAKPL